MSIFNAFVEFVAKTIALPLSKKNTTLSVHTPSQKPWRQNGGENIEWHKENGTYTSSYIISAIIVTVGILTLAGIWNAAENMQTAFWQEKLKHKKHQDLNLVK